MMPRAAIVCAALSLSAHVGGVLVATDGPRLEIAGSAPAQARLGNSFQDVASDGAVAISMPEVDTIRSAAKVVAATPVVMVAPVKAVVPAAISVQPPQVVAMPVVHTEHVTGRDPVTVATAMDATLRPRPRPQPKAEVPDPAPVPQPDPRPTDGKPQAVSSVAPGAAVPERRGVTEGAQEGVANDAGTGRAAEAGSAAASSYPGTVMRKISRTRKPRVGAQGTAIVGFEIGPEGDLAQATILRSSGAPAIDQAALDHLRRAAPFPVPPSGAERRFQVEYVSRG